MSGKLRWVSFRLPNWSGTRKG